MPAFRTVTVGDSVAWGQGLREAQKFHTLAVARIARALGPGVVPENTVLAHSGAVVTGSDTPALDARTAHWQEVPHSTPTVLEQATRPRPDPDVRLVIATGGINDADFRTIVSPFDTDDRALERLVHQKCYVGMGRVIRRLRTSYPDAVVVVVGYYPILSEHSDARVLRLVTSLCVFLLGAAGFLLGEALVARAVQRVRRFHLAQLAALRKAVAEAHDDDGVRGPGVLFAHPAFGPRHAVGAPEALLWTPKAPADLGEYWDRFVANPVALALDLAPDDDVARERQSACVMSRRGNDLVQCNVASLGHPNRRGAERYGRVVAERYLGNRSLSVSDAARRLDGRRPARFRRALRRYGLGGPSGGGSVRAALQHTRVDVLQVLVRTRDVAFAGTDHDVRLSVGPGRSWALGAALTDADLVDDFERGAQALYVVDPAAGDLDRPLHLWDVQELALELRFNPAAAEVDGAWEPEWVRLLVNGRSLHKAHVDRPLRVNPLSRRDRWVAPGFPP